MGQAINTSNISDLPEAISIDGIDKAVQTPAGRGEAAQEQQRPAQSQQAYRPSEYTVRELDRLPKDDIRKTLGIDIDTLVQSTRRYGILEALAAGEWTPEPIPIYNGGVKSLATVRIYRLDREPGWDCEVHKVNLAYAKDKDGRPYMNANGNYVTEVYRNPLQKGVCLMYNGKPFTPEEMDQLRLTGHLQEPKRGVNRNGEEISTIISVDPWNNHEICRTSSKVVRNRLCPAIYTRDESGRDIILRTNGCTRIEKDGQVYADVTVTDRAGQPVKAAADGSSRVLLPVNRPAILHLAGRDGQTNLNLSAAQVGRLSPSVTFFTSGDEKVVTFLSAKQLGELSLGHGVWVGDRGDMSYTIEGLGAATRLTPVRDRSHSAHIQYDAFSAKLKKTVDFKYALNRELAAEQKASVAERVSRPLEQADEISVGNHI